MRGLNRTAPILALAGLAFQAAGSGPVGGILPLAPDVRHGWYHLSGVAYSDATDRYLSVHAAPGGGIRGILIEGSAGTATAPAPLELLPGTTESPAIAWNSGTGRHLLTFLGTDADGYYSRLYGLVLDGMGVPLGGGEPFEIDIRTGVDWPWAPQIASDGNGWMVVWIDWHAIDMGADIWSVYLKARGVGGTSTNGTPVFSTGVIDLTQATFDGGQSPVVAGGPGMDYLAVWKDPTVQNSAIVGRTISAMGTLGAMRRYDNPSDLYTRHFAGVAANSESAEYLVAWSQQTTLGNDVDPFVRRAGSDGAPLGPVLNLSPGGNRVGYGRESVAPAWSGEAHQYVVVWEDASSVGTAPGSLMGVALDQDDLSVMQSFTVTTAGSTYTGHQVAVTRGRGTQAMIQWEFHSSDPVRPLKARAWDLGSHPGYPDPPSDLRQFRLDGVREIPLGDRTHQGGFVASAAVGEPAAGACVLEVELQEAGVPFTGTPTMAGEPVSSGGVAGVTLPVELGRSYHWQARTLGSTGRRSAWVSFGTHPEDPTETDLRAVENAAPVPVGAGQFEAAAGRSVPLGHRVYQTREGSLQLRAEWVDDGDSVAFDVEVRAVGVPFSGIPTLSSAWSEAGPSEIMVSERSGRFHWQYRLRDDVGAATDWIPFGGNSEDEADFELVPDGSMNAGRCLGSASPGRGVAGPGLSGPGALGIWALYLGIRSSSRAPSPKSTSSTR